MTAQALEIPTASIVEQFGSIKAFADRLGVPQNTVYNWQGSHGRAGDRLYPPRWYTPLILAIEADVGSFGATKIDHKSRKRRKPASKPKPKRETKPKGR